MNKTYLNMIRIVNIIPTNVFHQHLKMELILLSMIDKMNIIIIIYLYVKIIVLFQDMKLILRKLYVFVKLRQKLLLFQK